jgi:transcriptional regulator with XRE-family HTH domain
MMPLTDESFGARLRRERERRQISLRSIADTTKIGIGLLQALERDDVSRWPAGIFRRAFIRAYAEAAGLDAAEIVREFQEAFPPSADEQQAPRPQRSDAASRSALLRLRLADDAQPFLPAGLRFNWRRRCAAIAWDLAVVLTIGAILSVTGGAFWISLALATIGYYAGAVLFLGNTPGVCLAARTIAPFRLDDAADDLHPGPGIITAVGPEALRGPTPVHNE